MHSSIVFALPVWVSDRIEYGVFGCTTVGLIFQTTLAQDFLRFWTTTSFGVAETKAPLADNAIFHCLGPFAHCESLPVESCPLTSTPFEAIL